MNPPGHIVRLGTLVFLGGIAVEVLIMMSPFAGLFYATAVDFGPLSWLSGNAATAWLNGFFLNHSVVTTSALLEWQREIGLYLFILGFAGSCPRLRESTAASSKAAASPPTGSIDG